MVIDGYTIHNCDCVYGVQQVEFVEAEDGKFYLQCFNCGNKTNECNTKETAVHKWNSKLKVLYS